MRAIVLILFITSNSLAAMFLELCLHSTDLQTQQTIRAIKEAIKDSPHENEISCEETMTKLYGMTSLNLNSQNISNLRPLSGLHNLKTLFLSHNNISDLWALQDLPQLVLLDLSSNNIKDIGALSDFSNLQAVFLDNNKISNIIPIKDIYGLKQISLEDNPILTNLEYHQIEEIKGLINSLIFFRSYCTIQNYAPIDLDNTIEAAIFLNDMADRGDLSYFRALIESQDKVDVLDNQELWNLLSVATKKIIFGLSHASSLTNFLVDQFKIQIITILSTSYEDNKIHEEIMNTINKEFCRIEKAIQYFIMSPQVDLSFNTNNYQELKTLFLEYIKPIKNIKKEYIIAAIKVYFSPRFVTRALEKWEPSLQHYPSPMFGNCRLTYSPSTTDD